MNFTELSEAVTGSEIVLQQEMKDLESIFENIKESMRVRSYEEIFPR